MCSAPGFLKRRQFRPGFFHRGQYRLRRRAVARAWRKPRRSRDRPPALKPTKPASLAARTLRSIDQLLGFGRIISQRPCRGTEFELRSSIPAFFLAIIPLLYMGKLGDYILKCRKVHADRYPGWPIGPRVPFAPPFFYENGPNRYPVVNRSQSSALLYIVPEN